VLHLLWRGIAIYAVERKARFLVGCSSLTSQDSIEGAVTYRKLQRYLVSSELRTQARSGFRLLPCADDPNWFDAAQPQAPPGSPPPATGGTSSKLLCAYLAIGAKICGPPAIDREFGTIDFLTLLDLHRLPVIVRAHFLR
jgi:putative hemolysin